MRRIFVSVGLAALGAGSVSTYAAMDTGLDTTKPWSVQLSLRGFYDDNIDSVKHGRDSFGVEISPSVKLHLSGAQTDFKAGYTYAADYYDKRPAGLSEHWDHTHTFDLGLQHNFTERYSVALSDSFVYGQQPDMIAGDQAAATFQRIEKTIRNYGSIDFTAQITRLFGVQVGYANSFFDYDSSGAVIFGSPLSPTNVIPSRSGSLDRLEHTVHLDTQWSVLPTTVLVVGYEFGETDYTGDEPIQANSAGGKPFVSDSRNSRRHSGYVGVNQSFRQDLILSARIGITYSDSYNAPNDPTTISPYARLNLTYTYLPESYVQLGLSHDRSANDRVGGSSSNLVQDSESTTIYASLHHRITPKFFGTINGSFQNSTIRAPGNPIDGLEERYYGLGLDLEYRFTRNLSMHAGYNYTMVDTDFSKFNSNLNYDRNQFYLGATIGY